MSNVERLVTATETVAEILQEHRAAQKAREGHRSHLHRLNAAGLVAAAAQVMVRDAPPGFDFGIKEVPEEFVTGRHVSCPCDRAHEVGVGECATVECGRTFVRTRDAVLVLGSPEGVAA